MISNKLIENTAVFSSIFKHVDDFNLQIITCSTQSVAVMNLTSLVDHHRVHEELILPISKGLPIVVQPIEKPDTQEQITNNLLAGHTVLLVDGFQTAISVQLSSTAVRSVVESENEYVERGPRDSFTESWQTNLGLIRRRIKSQDFHVKTFVFGTYTQTTCALLYITGIAPDELVSQVTERLNNIDLDALIDSSQLEAFLQEQTYTPFEQIQNTERPDIVAIELLKGRVALVVDGTPSCLVLPTTFFDLFESTSDHYQRPLVVTLRRGIRLFGHFTAAYFSAIYLSLVSYHSHLIPVKFVQIVAEKRINVPFPAWFEILVMQIIIDMTLEGIMRLPTRLGQIIGVSGAIVVGQAVITLNLISPGIIVIVSLSTIAGYVSPRLSTSFSISILRYINLAFGFALGLYGVIFSIMFWLVHLSGISPYHTPYLRPISPLDWQSLRDFLIRLDVPWVGAKQHSRMRERKGNSHE